MERGLGKVEYISISRIAVGMFLPVVAEVPPYLLLIRAHASYIPWEFGSLGPLCGSEYYSQEKVRK